MLIFLLYHTLVFLSIPSGAFMIIKNDNGDNEGHQRYFRDGA